MIIYLFQALIRLYQILLSPFFGAACRFYPSCSHYALDSIEHYGTWRGTLHAARRLSKCHPFSKGGYDPVLKI